MIYTEYDLGGVHWRCDCGCKDFELRLDNANIYKQNYGGGVFNVCCSGCGKFYSVSLVLALTAEWVKKQVKCTVKEVTDGNGIGPTGEAA